ncbi:MAG: glycerol kinase GlpK [Oscillospiraceae bacterium]|nr:glycerol kinase GlpK [Oscillospiraceae bacterium]
MIDILRILLYNEYSKQTTAKEVTNMQYILSLDQGTTSSRAVLFDAQGAKVYAAQYEFPQIYPQPGWVEHDPEVIFETQLRAAKDCLAYAEQQGAEVAAIGITNQRETTTVWDKATGKPVYNAIVWQCRRTADTCAAMAAEGRTDFVREKTGLVLDAYFSATKLQWILRNVPGVMERAQRGELLFGTIDTWLIYKLTGGRTHVTDRTNSSRTMLYNIHTLQWDAEILDYLGIPACMLPDVCDCSGDLGMTNVAVLGAEIPVCGCAGDQQAALFGQCCFRPGDVKNTYGTGGFLLMNTGELCTESKNGLLTTIGCSIGGKVTYALEGSVFVSGAVIQWLRDGLQLIESAAETEAIAHSVPDTGGVYFVPAFVGLGTPYWDSEARGLLCGMTRGTGRAHIVRAALEAIAYQTADVIRAMEQDTAMLGTIKVDGGASQNGFLMQFQADLLGQRILRPDNVESTAAGAAFLAGLACGMWKDPAALEQLPQGFTEYRPAMDAAERDALLNGWHTAVKRCTL